MRNLMQDVRFGLRVLTASPAFSLVAALTLGLGIACTTTVFSWIDSMLLHPYPGTSRSDELASVEMVTASAPNGGTNISWPDYRDYRDHLKALSGLAVRRQCAFTLGDGQSPRLVWGELVSGNYFEVMGVKPVVGRVFTQEEGGDSLGAYPVAVISARLWRNYFHSDPAIAGKVVRVNRHSLTIAGVAPANFRGGSPVMQYDLWIPVTMGVSLGSLPESTFRDRDNRGMLNAICRRRAGCLDRAGARRSHGPRRQSRRRQSENQSRHRRHHPAHLGRAQRRQRLSARAALHSAGRLVRRPPDCLRQRRQPPAGPFGRPAARVRHPLRARRGPWRASHSRCSPRRWCWLPPGPAWASSSCCGCRVRWWRWCRASDFRSAPRLS